tara:strand:+ start:384 stop:1262 length:879 start_codon:yes stop_codon:yes gene_type:complete
MSGKVITGDDGFVELKRTSLEYSLQTSLVPSDVNTGRKRFSVEGISESVITGDRIEISTVDGSNLELVSGHSYPDGSWFVHVDPVGGMRLFSSFDDSLTGKVGDAMTLVAPSSSKAIQIKARNTTYRPLAKVRDFEFTTNRELIQTETLGSKFKEQYENGLIQGQGTLNCFWEHRYLLNDPDTRHAIKPEFAAYLARLILRLDQGCDFEGRFFMFREENNSSNNCWWECEAQITNCGITVPAGGVVETRIEFVTTGRIRLKTGNVPGYLLQESTDYLLQETGDKIFLEDDGT